MYSPHLDRLAANLPVYRGYHIKGNPRFPRINAWFAALNERPTYHRVKSDNITNNLLLRRRFGIEPIGNPLSLDSTISQSLENRAEAAERLSDNREVAIGDILKNSGVQSLAGDGDISRIKDAVDFHLRLLADYLLNGNGVDLPGGRTGGKESLDPIIAGCRSDYTCIYPKSYLCTTRYECWSCNCT